MIRIIKVEQVLNFIFIVGFIFVQIHTILQVTNKKLIHNLVSIE